MNIYFLKAALPNAIFKFTSNNKKSSTADFFLKNKISDLSIDSRTLKTNGIFLALQGQRVDGHDFLLQALNNGANVLIIEQKKENLLNQLPKDLLNNKLFIIVNDTLKALLQLAKNWRQRFDYPVVGITGSIGKTTTKQMLQLILQVANKSALIAFKNQNTNIGLSLNILKMKEYHEVAIFELGINDKGEMGELVDVLRPDIALITGIAHSHTHGLCNIKGVVLEKRKIFTFFKSNNIAIVNGDYSLLVNHYTKYPLVTFGLKSTNNIQARKITVSNEQNLNTTFVLKIYSKRYKIKLYGNHQGFVHNALAAASIASVLNIDLSYIVKGLESFKPVEGRFEKKLMKIGNGIIINDCYNASPESMKAAISAFAQMKTNGLKIAVLGDMLELGKKEVYWHRQIGRFLINALDLDFLILVGRLAKNIEKTAPVTIKTNFAVDWKNAFEMLNKILEENSNKDSLVLFKASRSIALDKIVNKLT